MSSVPCSHFNCYLTCRLHGNGYLAEKGDPDYCLSQREVLWSCAGVLRRNAPPRGLGTGEELVEAPAPLLGWEGIPLSRPPARNTKHSDSDVYLPCQKKQKKKHCRFFILY